MIPSLFGMIQGADVNSFYVSPFVLVSQDKIAKEANFILANQETIQSQITQVEAAIKQMEVNGLFCVLHHIFVSFIVYFVSGAS